MLAAADYGTARMTSQRLAAAAAVAAAAAADARRGSVRQGQSDVEVLTAVKGMRYAVSIYSVQRAPRSAREYLLKTRRVNGRLLLDLWLVNTHGQYHC